MIFEGRSKYTENIARDPKQKIISLKANNNDIDDELSALQLRIFLDS